MCTPLTKGNEQAACHLVHLIEPFRTLRGSWSSYPQKTNIFSFWGAGHSPENSQGGRDSTERLFRDGQMDTQRQEEHLPGPCSSPEDTIPALAPNPGRLGGGQLAHLHGRHYFRAGGPRRQRPPGPPARACRNGRKGLFAKMTEVSQLLTRKAQACRNLIFRNRSPNSYFTYFKSRFYFFSL